MGVALLLGSAGCDQQALPVESIKGSYIKSAAEFGVVVPPEHSLSFCIDGTLIDSHLASEKKTDSYTIQVETKDSMIESEEYRVTGKELQVVAAADEDYKPAIPILKAPMYAGDRWSWTGTLGNPDEPIPAKAEISTSDEQIPYKGKSVPAILTEVNLMIGDKNPVRRTLRFWITKEYGILKREFGTSIRQPKEDQPEAK